MPIIKKSDENIRAEVLAYLKDKKAADPAYRVIDVGGAVNPWADEYVDAYVDINSFATSKRLFSGDISCPKVWEEIGRERFDFSICTHTLEDIRDPGFVIGKLLSVSKAGFIATPNKHTELSCVESAYWTGYCHHRWIFSVVDDATLRIFPKLPLTSYFSPSNRFAHLMGRLNIGALSDIMRKVKRHPVAPGIKWIKKEKIHPGNELGFIWEDGFSWEFANGDYAGRNVFEAARLYTEGLEAGL